MKEKQLDSMNLTDAVCENNATKSDLTDCMIKNSDTTICTNEALNDKEFEILKGKIKLDEQRLLNNVNLDEQKSALNDQLFANKYYINTTILYSEQNVTNTTRFNFSCSCCDSY